MTDPGIHRRVLVPPARGTVIPVDVAEGTTLGSIGNRGDAVDVSAAHDGVLADWLVHHGDLADAGDPLARLHPEVSQ